MNSHAINLKENTINNELMQWISRLSINWPIDAIDQLINSMNEPIHASNKRLMPLIRRLIGGYSCERMRVQLRKDQA